MTLRRVIYSISVDVHCVAEIINSGHPQLLTCTSLDETEDVL